jgi:hypothetical protein
MGIIKELHVEHGEINIATIVSHCAWVCRKFETGELEFHRGAGFRKQEN